MACPCRLPLRATELPAAIWELVSRRNSAIISCIVSAIVSANQCHISLQTEMENNQLLVLENEWKWSNDPLHSVFMSSFYLLIFPFSWEGSAVECFRRTGVGFSLVLHTLRLHAAINAFLQDTGQWGSLSWTMFLFFFFRKAGFWATTSISKRAEQHQPQPFI